MDIAHLQQISTKPPKNIWSGSRYILIIELLWFRSISELIILKSQQTHASILTQTSDRSSSYFIYYRYFLKKRE